MSDHVKLSASQIKTYSELCPRRWWYDQNRPRTTQPSAAFGSEMHRRLEIWLGQGIAPGDDTLEGATATAGLGLIPPPIHAEVERQFKFEHGGALYRGAVDYTVGYEPGERVVIGDHKSIGNLRYAKTEDELLDDSQRIIYAHEAAERYQVEHVTARWVYYQRATPSKKPKARAVEFSERRGMIRERFEDLHERRSLPIIQAKREDRGPSALPRNLESCSLFPPNGCPYKIECHKGIDPMEQLHAAIFL
jgi:hypothetical protein